VAGSCKHNGSNESGLVNLHKQVRSQRKVGRLTDAESGLWQLKMKEQRHKENDRVEWASAAKGLRVLRQPKVKH